jgi:hypothetical protein
MIFGFRNKCVVIIAPLLENVKPPGVFKKDFTVCSVLMIELCCFSAHQN